MKTNKQPVLFVTHGSPLLAIDPGATGPLLGELGQRLRQQQPKAILVVSAHWLTSYPARITASEKPEIIYDFGGFPDELYRLTYPVAGAPDVSKLVKNTLTSQQIETELDFERGLDHGAWIALRYLFPEADIPVLELSIPWPMQPQQAINFGQALIGLREQGILIIASGSLTHNLRDVGYRDGQVAYIKPFSDWVDNAVSARDLTAIADFQTLAPYARQAHPTVEHFLPLIIALGASEISDQIEIIDGGVTYQALAMKGYLFSAH